MKVFTILLIYVEYNIEIYRYYMNMITIIHFNDRVSKQKITNMFNNIYNEYVNMFSIYSYSNGIIIFIIFNLLCLIITSIRSFYKY